MQVGLYQATVWVWGIFEETRGRVDGVLLVIELMVWSCVFLRIFLSLTPYDPQIWSKTAPNRFRKSHEILRLCLKLKK